VQAVIHYLLRETCAPYMAMLQEWIMKGVINDPYHEFLVMENRDVSKNDISTDFNDAYWYAGVPSFPSQSARSCRV
jgi:gamma-tubulin complex component 2